MYPVDEHGVFDFPPPYDDGEEYDEYIFLPSILPGVLISPNVLLPELLVETGPLHQLSTPVDWYLDSSRFEDEGLILSPPLCPPYTETSDFVDTASSTCGLKTAGYSRVFRTGLATKSDRITTRIDVWLNKLKITLRKLQSTWRAFGRLRPSHDAS